MAKKKAARKSVSKTTAKKSNPQAKKKTARLTKKSPVAKKAPTSKKVSKKSAKSASPAKGKKAATKGSAKTTPKKAVAKKSGSKASAKTPASKTLVKKSATAASNKKVVKSAAKKPAAATPKKKVVKKPSKAAPKIPAVQGKTRSVSKKSATKTQAKKAPAKSPTLAAVPSKPNSKALKASKDTKRKSFLREMEASLLAELKDLNVFIQRMKDEHMSLHGNRNADTTDTASEALDDELALQIAEIEARRRMMIRQALSHIEDGTFGLCEVCTDSPLNLCQTCPYIPPMRLKAVPSARLCIECKQLEEQYGTEHLEMLKEDAAARAGG